MSIIIVLSKAVPQGKHCLDRDSAIWTALRAEEYHVEMLGFKMSGFRDPPVSVPEERF